MNQQEKIQEMKKIFARCMKRIQVYNHCVPVVWGQAVGVIEDTYQHLRRLTTGEDESNEVAVTFYLDSLLIAAAAAKVLHEKGEYAVLRRNDIVPGIQELLDGCLELAEAKGHDYAGDDDACSNLRDFGWQGVVVRLSDKAHRLKNFVRQGTLRVKDEAITDTLRDIVNYSALACIVMATDLQDDEEQKSPSFSMQPMELEPPRKRLCGHCCAEGTP